MAENRKRVFISFAIEDEAYRNLLVGHARNPKIPFDFVDFSVKQAWDEKWKTNCRSRVKSCDGLIALISNNTASADGQLWEITCADAAGVPAMLMWINDERPRLPALLNSRRINISSWPILEAFIDKL